MSARMAKLDRALALVYLLAESGDGLTLDEMAAELGVNRRTAERLRDIVRAHFDLEEIQDDRRKRYRIRESLRRAFAKPTAAEVAALQAEVDARVLEKAPRATELSNLLHKVKAAFDPSEKRRLDPDLDALVRLQRTRVPAGPMVDVDPEALARAQEAILKGLCLEFNYQPEGASEPQWRRVAVYGLIHGPITYLVGKMPASDQPPVLYRFDRVRDVSVSSLDGGIPDGWDLDEWLRQSFGIWREDDHEIVLRVLPSGVARARAWRFHPVQEVTEEGDALVVRFHAGGLREIADHLFTWGGEVVIEGPDTLKAEMRERLAAAAATVRVQADVA